MERLDAQFFQKRFINGGREDRTRPMTHDE